MDRSEPRLRRPDATRTGGGVSAPRPPVVIVGTGGVELDPSPPAVSGYQETRHPGVLTAFLDLNLLSIIVTREARDSAVEAWQWA